MKSSARTVLGVSVLGLLSLAASGETAARPETIGVISVAEPPGPTAELAELVLQLRNEVADRTSGVLEMSELRDRMSGQTSTVTLTELDRAYAGGLALYHNGDFDGAIRTLRAIADDVEKLPDSGEAFDQWTRAMMLLARSHQTVGHRADAAAAIERLVRAAPAVNVDARQYPPTFRNQVDEAKARLAALPNRKLTVESPTAGVEIYVDGRMVGTAPLTVVLVAGQYRVSGRWLAEVRTPRFDVDLTSEDQTMVVNVEVPATFRPGNGPGLALPATNRDKGLIAAGALLGVDKVVAGSLLVEGDARYFAGALHDVRKGMLVREGIVRLSNRQPPPDGIVDLAKFLITGRREASVEERGLHPAVPREVVEPPRPNPSSPDIALGARSKSSTNGWIAFGAGVAGIGLGAFAIAEGFSAKSSYNNARAMLDGDALKSSADPAKYNQAIASGDSAKRNAIVAGGLAVGTVAVGGLLGYLSYKETKEVGPFRF